LKLDKHAIQDALIVLNKNVKTRSNENYGDTTSFHSEFDTKLKNYNRMNKQYRRDRSRNSTNKKNTPESHSRQSQGRPSYNIQTITVFIKKSPDERRSGSSRSLTLLVTWLFLSVGNCIGTALYLVLTYSKLKTQLNDLAQLSIVGSTFHTQGGLVAKNLYEQAADWGD
jgi:hypothetical protein